MHASFDKNPLRRLFIEKRSKSTSCLLSAEGKICAGLKFLREFPGGPLTEGSVSSTSVRTGFGNAFPPTSRWE